MLNLALFISGSGTTAVAVIRACLAGRLRLRPVLVVASKKNIAGIAKVTEAGVAGDKVFIVDPREFDGNGSFALRLLTLCRDYGVDLIGQYGWLPLTPVQLIREYENRIINQHPGPLDDSGNDFGGRGMYGRRVHAAVIYFRRVTGHDFWTEATAHFVTPEFDRGKVIGSRKVAINSSDTVENLRSRVLPVEHEVQIEALSDFARKRLKPVVRDTVLVKTSELPVLESAKKSLPVFTLMADKLKILVVGSGGREHALAWKLARSRKVAKVYCAPGNAGTEPFAVNVPIPVDDVSGLAEYAKKEGIDMTFIGPEAPLLLGITDLFASKGLVAIGPSQKAAMIEGSKVFAKRLMQKYGIPTAPFSVFSDYNNACKHLRKRAFPLVIKADGQCLGKGVMVADNIPDAERFLEKLMVKKAYGSSGEKVIIEDCLSGQEVSFMAATDGDSFQSFLPSQDHKRAFDNDLGPNTGGMGAYAPLPYLDRKFIRNVEEKIISPVLNALRSEGCPFSGIIYPGLILTEKGPMVLEFNCRFGDPETQPLMALLATDLVDVFLAIKNRNLDRLRLQWKKGYAVCVILASPGYPAEYESGIPLKIDSNPHPGISFFHSGTVNKNGKIFSSGGRVMGVTSTGITLISAIRRVYGAVLGKYVHFKGMHYRRDIAAKSLDSRLW